MFRSICWVRPSAPRHSRVEPLQNLLVVIHECRCHATARGVRRATLLPSCPPRGCVQGAETQSSPALARLAGLIHVFVTSGGITEKGGEEKKRKRTQKATILRELTLTFKASTPCRLVRALLGRMATMSRASWRAHSAR